MIAKAKQQTKKALKAPAHPVPQNEEQAAQLLADIGKAQGAMKRIAAKLEERKLELAMKASKESEPLAQEIEAKFEALFIYANAHRRDLLKGDLKTARLATGTLSWRWTPPKVQITKGKDQEVMEQLTGKKLDHCIRTICEVNKEAILAEFAEDPEFLEGIAGIKVTQTEQFAAEADAGVVEVVATIKPAKESRK